MLSVDDLRKEAEAGAIDTVVTAFTDMQGRLFGKRIQVEYFLDEVTEHGVEGCNYLLALDMEMEPVPGYEMANWEKGYGDFGIAPDMATLRRIPWLDRTALVLCDVVRARRLAGRRLAAPGSDRPVRARPRDGLHAAVRDRARVLPLQGELRRGAREGLPRPDADDPLHPRLPHPRDDHGRAVPGADSPRHARAPGSRSSSPRARPGTASTRSTLRYADAVTSADRHAIYKNGVKEIAFLNGISATFMAKPSEKDIGSSCHVHSSLIDSDGKSVFVDESGEETDIFRHYLGGMRYRVRELALMIAPSINSYKRYAAESWAPTSISWGRDNRTCGFRIVGHGSSRRVECRIPGADMNPYLGIAALLAAGLDGIENQTDPGPELVGNAYEAGEAEPFPSALREALELWEGSDFVRNAFGEQRARSLPQLRSLRAAEFDQIVTDYERRRMFERG